MSFSATPSPYRDKIVGISMGTNCASLVADLFLFVMGETSCCLCQTIIKLIISIKFSHFGILPILVYFRTLLQPACA